MNDALSFHCLARGEYCLLLARGEWEGLLLLLLLEMLRDSMMVVASEKERQRQRPCKSRPVHTRITVLVGRRLQHPKSRNIIVGREPLDRREQI
jgi:hypothetical protein